LREFDIDIDGGDEKGGDDGVDAADGDAGTVR